MVHHLQRDCIWQIRSHVAFPPPPGRARHPYLLMLCRSLNKEMSGLSGKGESGMGRVRGKDSFNAFTHSKVVGIQAANFDPLARYPPYKVNTADRQRALYGNAGGRG